jgi:hypothetical protein
MEVSANTVSITRVRFVYNAIWQVATGHKEVEIRCTETPFRVYFYSIYITRVFCNMELFKNAIPRYSSSDRIYRVIKK